MIELKEIYKTYQMGEVEVKALSGVSLKVEAGEFVAIMGPSGSGKSTLLHILGFLDRPDSGSYLLQDKDIAKLTDNQLATLRNHLAGFVFQQFYLLSRMTALQNAELPLIYAGKRHLKEKAWEKIKEVGLQQRGSHWPSELSGGEQQRVAIARSLVNEPRIVFADEPTGNLDTKSEEEIVAILKDLNAKGKTIIMVTHEQEIAAHAKRIIRMRDGKIISDERIKDGASLDAAGKADFSIEDILSGMQKTPAKAEFIDHLRQAMHAIVFNKMRSILSMLGILIGVAAVIAMLALGQGAKDSIAQRLASLGSNLLMIRPGSHRMHGVAMEAGTVTRFTLQDAEAIARLSDKIRRVSASVSGRAQLVYADKNWNTRVEGTGADYAAMRAAQPTIGRFFSDEELRMRQKVVLLGTTVSKELFGENNPLGASIKINRISFQVIGVLPAKGAAGFHDQDDVVIIPVTTAMYRLLGKDYIDSIDVEVLNLSLMQEAQEAIGQLIIERHRLEGEKEDSFEIQDMAQFQEALESTAKTMTWLLGSIAAISLLVGGIGIMNIMLVSVTERTREIGLRKAVGAKAKDILIQFLIESVVMTFLGGTIGILFGTGIAVLLSVIAGWTTRVMPSSIILATTFSITVGIGFGLWPAQKASHLNPIEALRYE
jgi:macrolide transport system ATP-binding/permease protein